ncbi:hypothetical protein DFH29DRAFT_1069629 [Suillus ampliporus]|nr:hypothetical protein DFH29DRAFT_1069629 [Suillus ampliporus]
MPSKVRGLIELTRIHWFPVGSDFMFWPFAWGSLAASYHVALPMNEVVKNTLFYALLGTLVHSAGCVINDMLDRDFDRKVERSKGRPIASGAVTMTEASVLLAVLVATYLLHVFDRRPYSSCTRCCRAPCLWRDVSADEALDVLAFFVPRYSVFKKIKAYRLIWFQGFAASWAVPFTWVATTGEFDWGMILNVAIASCCWTCLYDTIYACQDKKDDEKAGVKSMAVRLGDRIRPALSIFDVTFFACLLWAGYLNGQHLPFYILSVIAPFLPLSLAYMAGRHGAAMVCAGLFVDHYFNLASLTI